MCSGELEGISHRWRDSGQGTSDNKSGNRFWVAYVVGKKKQKSLGFFGGIRNIFLNDLIVQEWRSPRKQQHLQKPEIQFTPLFGPCDLRRRCC